MELMRCILQPEAVPPSRHSNETGGIVSFAVIGPRRARGIVAGPCQWELSLFDSKLQAADHDAKEHQPLNGFTTGFGIRARKE